MILLSLPARRLLVALVVIGGGAYLRLRGSAHHIPASYIHYGYWALWAALVYFLVALLLRSRPQNLILLIAVLVCALVEASKLSHTPALDVFRLTQVGAWMLGKTFSYWNFAAYAAGLAVAYGIDALLAGNPFQKSGRRRR